MKKLLIVLSALSLAACAETAERVNEETGETESIENLYVEEISDIKYGPKIFIFTDPEEGCRYVLLNDGTGVAISPFIMKGRPSCSDD
tara:strand:+ start:1001 stop:1264 length:264 start_codon:yes stop_codon:yes gene_type:complete